MPNFIDEIQKLFESDFYCELVLSRRSGPEHLSILKFWWKRDFSKVNN